MSKINKETDQTRLDSDNEGSEDTNENDEIFSCVSSRLHESLNTVNSRRSNKTNNNLRKQKFRVLLVQQLIKAVSVIYAAFGTVAAVTFFLRQVIVDTEIANSVWNVIGIIDSLLILLVVVLIIISKIIINKNPKFITSETNDNRYLFYSMIVIPGAFSWFYLLFALLRNSEFLTSCARPSDITLPISWMIFIMAGVVIFSDIINNKIDSNQSTSFYLVYKASGVFSLVTVVNSLVFEVLHIQSDFLQVFLSNKTNPSAIYCYNKPEGKDAFFNINNVTEKYFQMFFLIFSLMSIIILLKPLKQFDKLPINEEEQPLIPPNNPDDIRGRNKVIPTYLSFVIIGSIIIFLLNCVSIILKLMPGSSSIPPTDIKLATNILPIPSVFISGIINYFLLVFLHKYVNLLPKIEWNMKYIYTNWISLFGMIMYFLNGFINDFQELSDNNNNIVYSFGILYFFINCLESVMQAVIFDYLFRLDWESKLYAHQMSVLNYLCIPLMANNIGMFIIDYFNVTGNDIFKSKTDPFNSLIWIILNCFSTPLILIFRSFGFFILFLFITTMKSFM